MPDAATDPLSPRAAVRAWMEAHPAEFALDRVEGDFGDWQRRLRARLWELLGGPGEAVKPDLRVDGGDRQEGFSRRRVTFAVEAGTGARTAAWLLTPEPGRRRPGGILALHGHGRGKDDPLAASADGAGSHGGYAAEMARRGYLVLVPDARGFGERADPLGRGCHVLGLSSLLIGRPIAGQRLRDDIAALSLLRALCGSPRLGAVGLSEGGRRTLLLAALDERVTAAAVSGYFTRLRGEIAAWERLAGWDICNAIPGLAAAADLPEIAALVLPRALCIDWGRADGLYTPAAVEAAAAAVEAAYAGQGLADRFRLHAFDGGHRFGGAPVLDWLEAQLAR
jgi:dienelactone hydrolase